MKTKAFDNVWDALMDTPEQAAHMTARSEVMSEIVRVIRGWNLSQSDVASRLGLTQPRVNDLLRGRISKFSMDALIDIAVRAHMRPHFRFEVERPRKAKAEARVHA
ncbi:MAG: XRE family transcriptional regulator [Rhizobiales bacterium]|nr:XRE family transcriptional regulator [Hyphomicrobiales bacterium]